MCIRDRHKAVIDFHKWVFELNSEGEPVRINFERVLDAVRISGVRVIHTRSNKQERAQGLNFIRQLQMCIRDSLHTDDKTS